MTPEEFRAAFRKEIDQVLSRISRRYGVTDDEMTAALHSSARKYLWNGPGGETSGKEAHPHAEITEFLSSLNHEDLCLAVACAKGDEQAWEDFFKDYRTYLIGIARSMTHDAGAAEQLADSTFADLYGVRGAGATRISKFSFYSGRGSLRGWLRAVVYQLSADHHRQLSRFVQPDEIEEMDRLVQGSATGDLPTADVSFVKERYRSAVATALRTAINQLEPRERLLLAYYYCDEKTLKEIGAVFKVHEATISRWLVKVQKKARKLVEKNLEREHSFNRTESREAMDLAAEEADIGVREYLIESVSPERRARKPAGGT